jgi:hypothetical protein
VLAKDLTSRRYKGDETLKQPIAKRPTKGFKSDGCSGGMSWTWRKWTNKRLPWEDACIKHDKAYWLGGSCNDRKLADRKLRATVHANGYPRVAFLMYYAVRIFGAPYWAPTNTWGYGHGTYYTYKGLNNLMYTKE